MRADKIKVFEGDDTGYEDWVEKNWGFVLIQRERGDHMIHMSTCTHLGRSTDELRLTHKPRRWAPIRHYLEDWCKEQTGRAPLRCTDCL